MYRFKSWTLAIISFILVFFICTLNAAEREKGIYISQLTLQNTKYISYLITNAKEVGINTFIVDYERGSPAYRKNIALVENAGLKYVARIVVFPSGGTDEEVLSEPYWESRYVLVKQAIDLGAKAIQLDYIRYKPSEPPSHMNAEHIYKVISWFKTKLEPLHIPLQIDVFGIAVFGESKYIGQNLKLFAPLVDVMCPMLYPSHFEPYQYHSKHPYETILESITALRAQLDGKVPFKLYPYIEMSNFRLWHPDSEIAGYIYAQIKATQDGKSDGWYAWSAGNKYNYLFKAMKMYPVM
jgi:hypothetical protein